MNLFNVSSMQTAKLAGASAAAESETVAISDNDFSQQYQQAIDENQPLPVVDSELTASIDAPTIDTEIISADLNINITDISSTDISSERLVSDPMAATDAVDNTLINIDNTTIVDDATQLMAAGSAFLQQLTQSNQQLNSEVKTDANAVNTSGNSLPLSAPLITDVVLVDGVKVSIQVSATETDTTTVSLASTASLTTPLTSATLASPVAMVADGQKSDMNVDGDVNNLPLPTTTATNASTLIMPTPNTPLGATKFDGSLVDDSRLNLGESVNTYNDSLAQQLSGLTSTSSGLKPEQSAVMTNVQSPLLFTREQAGEQVHERINIMMAKNLKFVDIRLDPPELGKIQIKLTLNQDQASVQFTVNNHQTRDIVEQAMPRLREMLQQQGLQLAQSSVQQETSQQFSGQQSNSSAHSQSGQHPSTKATAVEGQSVAESDQLDQQASVFVTENKDQVDYYA
ncbi:flagellar hook-length control protein FliK [Photobacterium kishitanii]|uniref:flagellar hook-length control protein FliK n=1 Tax=Photobacterium kishitanii TaxID=318456 RepID=UPI00071AEF4B|nr:flagellar hook-length control protein FliK [Photobacterium kishitanii]